MTLLAVTTVLAHFLVNSDGPADPTRQLLIQIDGNCTRAGQAIGVQDQCDVYSALLDTYLDRAIEGDPRAAFMVGLVYMDEDRFTTRSVEWFQRSADGGNKNGQYYLGLAYELGEGGLDENRALAHAWYQLSGDQGLGVAKSARDRISDDMSGEEITEAEGLAATLRDHAAVN